ncbi:hypothetical protein B0J11DRAFT_511060 [Dendryphion nanum]|uniref:Uncharacterized protein n=1 Tax=Dendryphion nanum TaxID=256645 RepID=A0A9P9D840_9PLEO|nr:hypothetical protein B0J11DRAFT_511060 [Dendryphion nanum]
MEKNASNPYSLKEALAPAVRVLDKRSGTLAWTTVLGHNTSPAFPVDINRATIGISASDHIGAYYLGAENSFTSTASTERYRIRLNNIPGIIRFNFETLRLSNSTNDGGHFASQYSEPNTTYYAPGAMFNAPFGPNGILIFVGGVTAPKLSNDHFGSGWENVFILDKSSNTSYYQQTTGDIPPLDPNISGPSIAQLKTTFFSAIDKKGQTFEIFVYGRWTPEFDTIYVLSLPSFTWHRTDFKTSSRRLEMQCSGIDFNSQAICVGGIDVPAASGMNALYRNLSKDEWPNCISVFDMSTWRMKDRYDADAPTYAANEKLKLVYESG